MRYLIISWIRKWCIFIIIIGFRKDKFLYWFWYSCRYFDEFNNFNDFYYEN